MSSNIFEIWDGIGRQTPFAVRRDNWSDDYYTIVEKVECKRLPYGKAFGYPTIKGQYSDHYQYDQEWRDEKLIPCCGCYQWSLAEDAEINKGKTIIAKPPKKNKPADSLDFKFSFGKYKGATLETVFSENPDYVEWALKNVEKFCLTKDTISQLKTINASIIFSDEAQTINEQKIS